MYTNKVYMLRPIIRPSSGKWYKG